MQNIITVKVRKNCKLYGYSALKEAVKLGLRMGRAFQTHRVDDRTWVFKQFVQN
jgi:hypothetical protein